MLSLHIFLIVYKIPLWLETDNNFPSKQVPSSVKEEWSQLTVFQYVLLDKIGSVYWIEIQSTLIKDNNEIYYIIRPYFNCGHCMTFLSVNNCKEGFFLIESDF